MTNITQKTHAFLAKNPSIIRNIGQDIINIRALSHLIKKRENLDASDHAVMSAIRRFDLESQKTEIDAIENILKDSKISTKSRLIMLTISRDFSFLGRTLPKIFENIDPSVGELMRIVEGRESFKILIDISKKDMIEKIIGKINISSTQKNIAEINIHLAKGYRNIPGIGSAILNKLASNNINVEEIITCLPEMMILVKEKDIGKAHDTLLSFFYDE